MSLSVLLKKTIGTLQREGVTSVVDKAWRTLHRAYRRTKFEPYVITRRFEGESLQFLIGDVIGEEWYTNYPGFQELQWIKANLRKGGIVVDCGAHHGLTGILFAKWVGPTGKVIGFEGLPHNVDVARKNIEMNNTTNFEIRNEAVGRQKGIVRFVDDYCGAVEGNNASRTIEVPMVSLDEIFQSQNPTFLKIDVEGFEIEVLYGARNVMAHYPGFAIEIHCARFKDRLAAVKELLGFLLLDRYEMFVQLQHDGEIVPYDSRTHRPELIAAHENPHFFGRPLARG